MKYEQIMDMLRAGKKLKVEGLNYVYKDIPTIKVVGTNNERDYIKLECVSDLSSDIYLVEKNIPMLDHVTVDGYTMGDSVPIDYICINPSTNRLKAHLQNGEEVDYTLSIFNLEYVTGEYVPDETHAINVKLWFFKSGCQDLFSEEITTCESKEHLTSDAIADYIRDTEWRYPGMSIVAQFLDTDWKPIIIDANTRRYKSI